MSSNNSSGDLRLDLDSVLASTPEDVRVLRTLRAQARPWLDLSTEELDALLPEGALDRRATAAPDRAPFTLDE